MTATDWISSSTYAIATLNAELILLKTRIQSLERLLLEKHLGRAKIILEDEFLAVHMYASTTWFDAPRFGRQICCSPSTTPSEI